MIEVKEITPKGRGIFAKEIIHKDTLIEAAPASSFAGAQWGLIKKTDIFKYCFVMASKYKENKDNDGYVVFGLSSLCNHSDSPNAVIKWVQNEIGLWAHLIAVKEIQPEEEILIFYSNIDDYSLAHEFI